MDRVFFPWSASVTLEIDGFNLDLRHPRESKAFAFAVVRMCASRTLRFTVAQRWYGCFSLLRLIAANYASQPVIGESFLRNAIIRIAICLFAITKQLSVVTKRFELNINWNLLIFFLNLSSCNNICYISLQISSKCRSILDVICSDEMLYMHSSFYKLKKREERNIKKFVDSA